MRKVPGLTAFALVVALAGCTAPLVNEPTPTPTPTSTPTADADAPGTPSDWRPSDSGPAEEAMGEAILDDAGIPIAYIVAEGDTPDAIRERFDLPWFSLAREDGAFMRREEMIFTGETLTFTLPN